MKRTIVAQAVLAAALTTGRTGWPPGLLQDDDPRLSRWLASRPGARAQAAQAARAARPGAPA